MQSQGDDFLLNEATQLLETAEESLNRPAEDVAAYMVCHNSRQALMHTMSYFLLKNNIQPKEPATLSSLWNQCKSEDARFQELDITHIDCRHEEGEEGYCLGTEKVSSCFKTARLVHGIVSEPTPGY